MGTGQSIICPGCGGLFFKREAIICQRTHYYYCRNCCCNKQDSASGYTAPSEEDLKLREDFKDRFFCRVAEAS